MPVSDERTAKAIALRRLRPFEEGPQSRMEPRILTLSPGTAATLTEDGRWTFQGVINLAPLFAGSGLINLWLFPDSDVDALVEGARERKRQVIVNTIANPDQHADLLRVASELCRHFPVLNAPDHILLHGREKVAAALQGIPGLDVPFCRRVLAEPASIDLILEYPVILRRTGTILGHTMQLVTCREEGAAFIARHRGSEIYMTRFRDTRSKDGLYRKYQTLLIGGEPHNFYMHFGRSWISDGYESIELVKEFPLLEEEEHRFLTSQLPPAHAQIFAEIHRRIGTDIFAVDYALRDDGTMILFEANAHQTLNRPDADLKDPAIRTVDKKMIRSARTVLVRKILDVNPR